MNKPKITVVGSSNTDLICRVPRIPRSGETILGKYFFTVQGGKGANQAVAAARAGGQVTFIACVGNDNYGRNAIEAYRKEGIDTDCIQIIDGVATGVALINVTESGENSISVAPGANSRLTPNIVENCRRVILQSDVILVQLEIPIETVYYVVELGYKANIPVVVNPAPAQKIETRILKQITLITPNENESYLLTGLDENFDGIGQCAMELQRQGTQTVIITLGSKGAYYLDNEQSGIVEGIAVKAVDTTAAGDTFNGYLAVALAQGKPIHEAITIANRAAALSVTRLGAQSSIPFMNDVYPHLIN